MILKKHEKNGITKAMYSSSTVCASIFNSENRDLTVIFKNGGQYRYPLVELTDYMRLETADSVGSIFNTYIKKKYPKFEKLVSLTETAINTILKEIDELKTEVEDKPSTEKMSKELIETMSSMVTHYIGSGKIEKAMITKLTDKITSYNNLDNTPQ